MRQGVVGVKKQQSVATGEQREIATAKSKIKEGPDQCHYCKNHISEGVRGRLTEGMLPI